MLEGQGVDMSKTPSHCRQGVSKKTLSPGYLQEPTQVLYILFKQNMQVHLLVWHTHLDESKFPSDLLHIFGSKQTHTVLWPHIPCYCSLSVSVIAIAILAETNIRQSNDIAFLYHYIGVYSTKAFHNLHV